MSHYGVPIVRVPETKLTPHKSESSLSGLKSYAKKIKRPLALDLFCGAGGLSLGLEEAGFDVLLGVDSYLYAVATHRANFGGVSLCGDLSDRKMLRDIGTALEGVPIALIAGGPPCQPFSRAGKNKVRSLGIDRGADDRRELWRSFVQLVKRIRPQTVLIENVPDLGFGENSIVFRKIVRALEVAGYRIEARILPAWHFGVPQHRKRLIIVGLRDGLSFTWPQIRNTEQITVRDAISDLSPVAGGARQIELPYGKPMTPFQRWCRRGLFGQDRKKVYDHLTRAVRDDDLEAFRLMKDGTLYSELPQRLRRYRADIFEDKYKRLPWDGLSRSITAHIGRDGYWYIHPEQHRTLTVREAARLQTFPDRFRFAGTPSHAFRQIGEAVPPLLARALGRRILSALKSSDQICLRPSTETLAGTMLTWFKETPRDQLSAPWRHSRDFWEILLGMTLFSGRNPENMHSLWNRCKKSWPTPGRFLNDKNRLSKLREVCRQHKSRLLTIVAKHLVKANANFVGATKTKILGESGNLLAVAYAIAGLNSRRPVTASITRVVERIFGESVNRSKTHAELLIGRAVGIDETGRAYAALLEVGDTFCGIKKTNCRACPLRHLCQYATKRGSEQPRSS